jgi:general secretion pathway protein G
MNTPRIGSRIAWNFPGFTLIELMLVMVILVILASLVTPMLAKHSVKAKIAAAKVDLRTYSTALNAFQMDCGRFPSNDEGLDALVNAPSDVAGWDGPYVEVLRSDPWGNVYIYQAPGTHFPTAFDLHSMGPDKITEGDDIANWQ